MHQNLINYIDEIQDKNIEATFTILDEDTAVCNHNVGNYTLEYISIESCEVTRIHIPFGHIKMLNALVALHNALNK